MRVEPADRVRRHASPAAFRSRHPAFAPRRRPVALPPAALPWHGL
ncbi:hypothetical protein HMPREF9946_03493 [Acetobacteraceae bacterium AT-5844]|nr:hypothetical protein HMPREF9946_03493 [Acetobacteraceae bacterium AT-5844]